MLGAAVALVPIAVFAAGALVLWLRLTAIGIPATRAVRLVSLQEMMLVGVEPVAFTVLAGLVAIALAWALHERRLAVTVLGAAGVLVAVFSFEASGTQRAIAIGVTLIAAANTIVTGRWLAHLWKAALAVGAVAVGALYLADETIAAVACAILTPLTAGAARLASLGLGPYRSRIVRLLARGGWFIRETAIPAGVVIFALVLFAVLGTWAIAALALLAGALAAVVHRWHRATVVFGAVIVFGTALIVLHDLREPGVRAVAMRGDDGSEFVGILVGRTPRALLIAHGNHCSRDKDLQLRAGRLIAGTITLRKVSAAFTQLRESTPGPLATAFDRAGRLLNDLRLSAGLAPHPETPSCGAEGVIDGTARKSAPVGEPVARRLAMRYRPLLVFNSRERWRPLSVEAFLLETSDGKPVHELCRLTCRPLRRLTDLADTFGTLDFAGHVLGGVDAATPALDDCPAQPPLAVELRDCDSGKDSAIYYHAVSANGRVYIDYWWFLRYNQFDRGTLKDLCRNRAVRGLKAFRAFKQLDCFDHEGDWEGVTAVTATGDPDRLEYVQYAAHEMIFRHPVAELERHGHRPVVYVADGSHAAYTHACPRNCPQRASIAGQSLPEGDTDGAAPWGRNDDAACGDDCLLPLDDATTWNRFTGYWGSRACSSGAAPCRLAVPPLSPARQRRYRIPWCYSNERTGGLQCDGT